MIIHEAGDYAQEISKSQYNVSVVLFFNLPTYTPPLFLCVISLSHTSRSPLRSSSRSRSVSICAR